MARAKKRNKKEILEAINGCAGIIITVAKKLSVDWRTARRYIYSSPETKAAYEIEIEHMGDICESVLFNAISKTNDVSSAKWYLSMRCRHRGYGIDINPPEQDDKIKIIVDMPETDGKNGS